MDCSQTEWLTDEEYWKQFRKKVFQNRIPLSGSMEFTWRCPLHCVHCYLGKQEDILKSRQNELGTDQWFKIIDQISDAGCLFLLISGGDPLLRKNFPEVYTYARTRGLIVTVFTSGILITDDIIQLFRELPPRAVEITLYGATRETYEKITGIKGSHEKCMQGIQRLLDNKINLRLKTILMTHNAHELEKIGNIAREYGVKFRIDPAISPCFNGDKYPIDLRISAKDIVEKEFSDDYRLREWIDYFKKRQGIPVSDRLYTCGAGVASFHIDPFGILYPCLMAKKTEYNLLSGSFSTGWRDVMPQVREKKADNNFICRQCDKRMLCNLCPPFFELETGMENIPSDFLCELSHERFNFIKQCIKDEKYDSKKG